MLKIAIPDNLSFADLELKRDHDGRVSYNTQIIAQVCELNALDSRMLFESDENVVARLIVIWYAQHRAVGGAFDSVAEDLIVEIGLN